MAKKLFIIIDVDENGRILDYNIDDKININTLLSDVTSRTDLVKTGKCPECSCDLEYTLLVPETETIKSENVDMLIEEEGQDGIYEIIEEEVQHDEEHFRDTGQDIDENEENIASDNLTDLIKKSPSSKSSSKKSKTKGMKKEIKEESVVFDQNKSNKKTKCSECGMNFSFASQLRVHMQRCHTQKSFCCHLCGSAFIRNKELQNHLLRHENPKPYECDLCSERYAVKNSLRVHMRTCHIRTNEGFYCDCCNNSKKYATELKLVDHHARVHSGNDRYRCNQCPRRFKYPESLRNHLARYHTPPELMKWYSCNECNFRGSTAKALEKHKLVHLDHSEKPFKCSYCDKGFGRRYEWNRHEMIHRAEKPFICGICGHMVRTNYLLQKHMRVHQEGRPYACSLCDKTYRDRDTYKKHMKAHAVQMEAQGEHLNLEDAMQHLANVHKTIPIKAKSFPVILSSSVTDETETLVLTEVQEDDVIIETSSQEVKEEYEVVAAQDFT